MTPIRTPVTAEQLATDVAAETIRELEEASKKIRHCVEQLTDDQVWWRAGDSQNSIANLILHLCGNIRQWIVSGIGGAGDVRDRPKEFSQRGPMPRENLLGQLDAAVGEAIGALSRITAADLLAMRPIQGFDVTGLAAIFHTLPHFRGHTQEIVHISRTLLGDRYKFAWTPRTPEQGALA